MSFLPLNLLRRLSAPNLNNYYSNIPSALFSVSAGILIMHVTLVVFLATSNMCGSIEIFRCHTSARIRTNL